MSPCSPRAVRPPSRSTRPIRASSTSTFGRFPRETSDARGGIWRSVDNGATWTQIFKPTASQRRPMQHRPRRIRRHDAPERQRRACTSASATGGAACGREPGAFYRTDDASGAAVSRDMTTAAEHRLLHGAVLVRQRVYTPAGAPDVVYLGGSFSYGQLACAVERPRLAAVDRRRRDLQRPHAGRRSESRRGDPSRPARDRHGPRQAAAVHHAARTAASSARTAGLRDVSAKCDARGLNAADTAFCKSAAQPGAEQARQHEQRAVHAAVPESVGERAAAAEPSPGRHAGQRDVPVQRIGAMSGPRSSTATAASPASTRPMTRCASTLSPARPTMRTSAAATRRSG